MPITVANTERKKLIAFKTKDYTALEPLQVTPPQNSCLQNHNLARHLARYLGTVWRPSRLLTGSGGVWQDAIDRLQKASTGRSALAAEPPVVVSVRLPAELASRLAALASRVDKQLLARLIGREQQQAELALVPSELLAVETAGAGLGGGSGAAVAGIDPLAELVAVAQLVDADVLAWPACEDESTPPAPPEPPPPPGQPTGPQEEL